MTAPGPVRTCIACGQSDDHPRHQTVLPDQTEVGHHMDCGKRLNPPCDVCTRVLDATGTADGTIGEDLRAQLVATDLTEVS